MPIGPAKQFEVVGDMVYVEDIYGVIGAYRLGK